MKISAIVISYNTRAMTLRCLETLRAEMSGAQGEIWVVDNASTDGSVEAIQAHFPEVQIIASERNLGFGAANNVAMARARGDYLLLLNSDAFPRPGAVEKLCAYLEEHPRVAVVGPRLLNEDGTLQLSCFRFPSPRRAWLENLWISAVWSDHPRLGDYRRWAHDRERTVDFAIGACLLVRRMAYEKVGGFDERFFMYQEEADWQRRFRQAGWEIAFTPAAEAVHFGGASGKGEPARMSHHFFESLDRYALLHHGRRGFLLTRAAMLVGCSLRAVLWSALALVPARRPRALQKARLHAALVRRQISTPAPA